MTFKSCIDVFNALGDEDQLKIVHLLGDFLAWYIRLSVEEQDEVLDKVRKYVAE